MAMHAPIALVWFGVAFGCGERADASRDVPSA
jgi:hypothetical protein